MSCGKVYANMKLQAPYKVEETRSNGGLPLFVISDKNGDDFLILEDAPKAYIIKDALNQLKTD